MDLSGVRSAPSEKGLVRARQKWTELTVLAISQSLNMIRDKTLKF